MRYDAWMLFWFRTWYQENPDPTWESFSTGLSSRFGGQNSGCKEKGDKAYKQILDEMVKQEEKWKHKDDETCSWSQKILASLVSSSEQSNQESCGATKKIQAPPLRSLDADHLEACPTNTKTANIDQVTTSTKPPDGGTRMMIIVVLKEESKREYGVVFTFKVMVSVKGS